MKIRISELRRLIKEAIDSTTPGYRMSQRDPDPGHDATDADYFGLTDEEATVPGKWHPSEGEPVDDEDLYRLGESDGDEADSFRSPMRLNRSDRQRTGKERFSIKDQNRDPVTDEPICFDCNLPGSDCDCEPHGRFE